MRMEQRISIAYAGVVVGVIGLLFGFRYDARTGFTSLIRFGERWSIPPIPEMADVRVHIMHHHGGYDGQFYAYLALRAPWRFPESQANSDAVAYRARRILMPAAAYTFGGGKPWWVIHVYSLINPLSWLALAAVLLKWLP